MADVRPAVRSEAIQQAVQEWTDDAMAVNAVVATGLPNTRSRQTALDHAVEVLKKQHGALAVALRTGRETLVHRAMRMTEITIAVR
jgi:hypothetical protein